jgi:hypothetical protein
MSPFYIELTRPGEDGLSIPKEDYQAIGRASSLPMYPEPESETISAEQGQAIADAVADKLPQSWSVEMISEFVGFVKRGPFRIVRVAY